MNGVEILSLVVLVGHVILCPFTKVEESFNLHATHDILSFGIYAGRSQYDHITFPGAVPRSFVGSLVLAFLTSPLVLIAKLNRVLESEFEMQMLVRSVLAVGNGLCLIFFYQSAQRLFGKTASIMALGLTLVQFHIPFYAGRTLPNMLAFGPVQIALALVLKENLGLSKGKKNALVAIGILSFTASILRLELVTLVGPLAIYLLAYEHASLMDVATYVLAAGFYGAVLSFFVDSYFWNVPVWPEFQAAYFNVIQGKSIDWGISPWHYYFTSALPKLSTFSLPFVVLSMQSNKSKKLVFPVVSSIVLLSFLQHKEWRFIIYAVPSFNLAACFALTKLSRTIRRILYFLLLLSTLSLTLLSVSASHYNYPGGIAIQRLYNFPTSSHLTVHVDSYACQTGASLFVLDDPSLRFTYDRNEDLNSSKEYKTFDYLVTSTKKFHESDFVVVETVDCFDGIKFGRLQDGGWLSVKLEMRECVWIMRNRRLKE